MMMGMGRDCFWYDYKKYGFSDSDFEDEVEEINAREINENNMLPQENFEEQEKLNHIDDNQVIENKNNIFDINTEKVLDIKYREL